MQDTRFLAEGRCFDIPKLGVFFLKKKERFVLEQPPFRQVKKSQRKEGFGPRGWRVLKSLEERVKFCR